MELNFKIAFETVKLEEMRGVWNSRCRGEIR